MEVYFNEEAEWEPEEGYTRGIPSGYEKLLERADEKDPVDIQGEGEGLIQNMVDGGIYGILEKREDPFTEYILEIGEYDREVLLLEDVTFLEQRHVQDTARVVRKGSKRLTHLEEIRTRLMQERWDSKLVELGHLNLDDRTPIH